MEEIETKLKEIRSEFNRKSTFYVIVLGAVLVFVGILFGTLCLQFYAMEHMIATNAFLTSMLSLLFGVPLLTSGITAYLVTKTNQK